MDHGQVKEPVLLVKEKGGQQLSKPFTMTSLEAEGALPVRLLFPRAKMVVDMRTGHWL